MYFIVIIRVILMMIHYRGSPAAYGPTLYLDAPNSDHNIFRCTR